MMIHIMLSSCLCDK